MRNPLPLLRFLRVVVGKVTCWETVRLLILQLRVQSSWPQFPITCLQIRAQRGLLIPKSITKPATVLNSIGDVFSAVRRCAEAVNKGLRRGDQRRQAECRTWRSSAGERCERYACDARIR